MDVGCMRVSIFTPLADFASDHRYDEWVLYLDGQLR